MEEGEEAAWGRKDEGENVVLRYLSGCWRCCCLPARGVRASGNGDGGGVGCMEENLGGALTSCRVHMCRSGALMDWSVYTDSFLFSLYFLSRMCAFFNLLHS